MAVRQIDGGLLRQMILTATRVLDANKDMVNSLNVFPVPDGDTGSNMSLTMLAASREVERSAGTSAGEVAQAAAQGSLMGARGNSGVILSQLFRGFARHAAEYRTLDAGALARALQEGVETAYKAVMKPVEGTLLTVAREAAAAAVAAARRESSIRAVLETCLRAAQEALARTPELLPVLKKAGVVDSGGMGYCFILTGYLEAVRAREEGREVCPPDPTPAAAPAGTAAAAPPAAVAGPTRDVSPAGTVAFHIDEEISHIQFPYDTELFICGENIDLDAVRRELAPLGDSLYVVGGPDLVKVHIHTDNPGPVLSCCIRYGELVDIQIHNMRRQHEDLKARAAQGQVPAAPAAQEAVATRPEPVAASAVVAVAAGPGLEAIFKSLGASAVVQGGQTMNPSTEDILNAIRECPADRVFVLPNNKNIIMAAEQAAALTDKQVFVVPTRSIPQGIAAMLAWQPDQEPEKTLKAMERNLAQVETGEITYAVRDTVLGDLEIRAGDILGIWNGQIVATGRNPAETLKEVLRRMVAAVGGEVITIYYGEGVAPEEAEGLAAELRAEYPDHEIEVQFGGQPLYFYVFSLE